MFDMPRTARLDFGYTRRCTPVCFLPRAARAPRQGAHYDASNCGIGVEPVNIS
jgi:hypothetical protein